MLIKSTHRLEFSNGTEKFLTAGGNVEQEAPDWIAEDDYFKANLADGRVTRLASPVVDTPVPEVSTELVPEPTPVPEPEKPKRGKATEQPSVTESASTPAPVVEKQVVDTGIPGF